MEFQKIIFVGLCLFILILGFYLHWIEVKNQQNLPQIVKFPEPRYDEIKNNLSKIENIINVQNKTNS